jgi:hypothetical protein
LLISEFFGRISFVLVLFGLLFWAGCKNLDLPPKKVFATRIDFGSGFARVVDSVYYQRDKFNETKQAKQRSKQ